MNGTSSGAGSLKSFYGYKETFARETQWVKVPRELTFVHTNNPYDDDESRNAEVSSPQDERAAQARARSNLEDAELAIGLAALAEGANRLSESSMHASNEGLTNSAFMSYPTHGLEALSAVASRDYNHAPPAASLNYPDQTGVMSSPNGGLSIGNATPAQHSNLDFILNPTLAGPSNSNIDPQLHSASPLSPAQQQVPQVRRRSSHVRTASPSPTFNRPRLLSKGPPHRPLPIENPELAFLLRDFAERAGFWMDLFDLKLFFATTVPVLAVRCPLLLYSCVALSAKCLARVDGRKPVMGGQVSPSRRSRMELWPGTPPDNEGWVRRAREYYDMAVKMLREALADVSRPPATSLNNDMATPHTRARYPPLPNTDSDELVGATAILCIYEFVDASGPEWSQHLDGAKSLFEIGFDRMVPLTLPPSPVSMAAQVSRHFGEVFDRPSPTVPRGLSDGRRAVFWNFARQDMLAAFINSASTRLDTTDLAMWRQAGLRLTSGGLIAPSDPQHPDYTPENAMPDDLIANALIWLLGKLINFIAAGDGLPHSISPMGFGFRQNELLEYWGNIDTQLRVWYEGLPCSFRATAALNASDAVGLDRELWYSRPMCASTMQSYHFARIQLLHNKPHVSTATPVLSVAQPNSSGLSLAVRHASYASILQQSRSHAKEIVAIGLGRSDEGTRIHSVQPLWTAGLVLGGASDGELSGVNDETWSWRRIIVGLLRDIERDMGWASEYRVQSLLSLWQLPSDWGREGFD